MNISISLIDRS